MAKRKSNLYELPPDTIIDVVMKKEMTIEQYYAMIPQAKTKGWHIQGFQKGVMSRKQK